MLKEKLQKKKSERKATEAAATTVERDTELEFELNFFQNSKQAEGNEIVESRNNRRRETEKSKITPEEATFWCNMTSKNGTEKKSKSHKAILCYK